MTTRRLIWILAGSCLAFLAVVLGGGLLIVLAFRDAPQAQDVGLSGCATTGAGNYTATVSVTNNSGQKHSYVVTVAFLGEGGTQIATATVVVSDLGSGGSAVKDAVGSGGGRKLVDCDVADVQRV